jgi:hypothetical protein
VAPVIAVGAVASVIAVGAVAPVIVVLSMDLALRHSCGAYKFEVATIFFLENLWVLVCAKYRHL